ncbi:DUF6624 domain-containing protein [Novosphingobium gossypii]|uniref:DUF6624 domain-containing protein n=1 Tax=Novosphingobium gossypii TaxID=1604774 RepID=UPI003D25B424
MIHLWAMHHARFLALAAMLVLTAAASPPPAVLAPYIHDGRFDPGDYSWLKGRFADASAADKTANAQVVAWVEACRQADREQTTAELADMGVLPPPGMSIVLRDPVCDAVAMPPRGTQRQTFAQFTQALDRATPIAETYLAAVRAAEETLAAADMPLREELLVRPVGEQMLRLGWNWSDGRIPGWDKLTADEKAIVVSRLGQAMAERDRRNTRWLKAVVEENGWPKISEVGERASGRAWLLVQHADADPPFQLKALRLMEPLLATGEVSKSNYAYLYDRVMLKIAGAQRYATQATCEGGKRVPRPLEDAAAVEARRQDMGLEPLGKNMARLQQVYGDCPKG